MSDVYRMASVYCATCCEMVAYGLCRYYATVAGQIGDLLFSPQRHTISGAGHDLVSGSILEYCRGPNRRYSPVAASMAWAMCRGAMQGAWPCARCMVADLFSYHGTGRRWGQARVITYPVACCWPHGLTMYSRSSIGTVTIYVPFGEPR